MTPPRVVVAIPTFDRPASLRRAVQSVLAQDYGNVLVFIADDASPQHETRVVAQGLAHEDERVSYVRHRTNQGVTANYNFLVRQALPLAGRDGFFMFLSDDDWLEPTYVACCVTHLQQYSDHALVAGRTRLHTDGGRPAYDPDVNLLDAAAEARVLRFCGTVLPTGVFAGVMPARVVGHVPPQRNVLGHDWLFLANVAYIGKIRTLPETAVNRTSGGVSTNPGDLARTLRVPARQARKPLITIAWFMFAELAWRSPVFERERWWVRTRLASRAVASLLLRRWRRCRVARDTGSVETA